jgi:hypothetical protein
VVESMLGASKLQRSTYTREGIHGVEKPLDVLRTARVPYASVGGPKQPSPLSLFSTTIGVDVVCSKPPITSARRRDVTCKALIGGTPSSIVTCERLSYAEHRGLDQLRPVAT